MPWETVKLNDGRKIPSLGFGTWRIPTEDDDTIGQVEQALSFGFNHIDTAQAYKNEEQAGAAIRESGLARKDLFVTTKYSGVGDIPTSIRDSLKKLGLDYVDLYLIHHPRLAVPDIPTAWAEMEKLQSEGLAKSIGVSNFGVTDLTILLGSAKVKPAVNQILLHPYVYAQQAPILAFAAEEGIIIEAYSTLTPVTSRPGGPIDKPGQKIAKRLGVDYAQVLLAWAKAKGAVVLTTSSKKDRLEGYIAAGDIKLTKEDMAEIELAGTLGARLTARTVLKRFAVAAIGTILVLSTASWVGIDFL